MIIPFDPSAEADLDSIGEWIATDNPARAVTFIAELRGKCATILPFPRKFSLVFEREGIEFRKLSHKRYLIFYSVAGETVRIERIIHQARDWRAIVGA